ncbi:FAD-dependent oxidoreductase [Microvirga rosea]|nr:FAD-dependent oxidoreductase [Microvirga rosea]
MSDGTERFDETYDVVVIGSGAGGMAAALTARKAGLDVVVIEKTAWIGGSTAISGGAVWIPKNPHLADVGLEDDDGQVISYLRAILGNRLRQDLIEAFLENGPRMVAFMEQETDVIFQARAYSPDYRPEIPGASLGGRTIDPAPFDGRVLGRSFELLRPPLKEFLAFGGMMVNRKDIDALLGMPKSLANFQHGMKILFRYFADRVSYPRGTRLLMGNALAGRLLKSAIDANIVLYTRTSARKLIVANDRVAGALVEKDGQMVAIGARRGVVLAAGGFPANDAMRSQFIPFADKHKSMAPAANTGDGIRLAIEVGGAVDGDNVGNAFWAPVSTLRRKDGTEIRFPHLILDRQKPGLLAVNAAGRRFVNEATSYHEFVEAMHRSHESAPTVPAILICDRPFIRRYGLGLVRPGLRRLRPFVEAGYLIEAGTINELAEKLGINAETLSETVRRMNDYAASGQDPEFGKGSSAYNRYLGDPAHKPNPCLGPIATAPFYAVHVWPGDIGTAAGLKVDAKARVLDRNGEPILGLFACGNDMNSIMAGAYPGAGITLGPALTFGYIAGQELARTAA